MLTASQLIKKHILAQMAKDHPSEFEVNPEYVNDLSIDELWQATLAKDSSDNDNGTIDIYGCYIEPFRCDGETIDISVKHLSEARHFESESRAAKLFGYWVGWTYYSGGGSYAYPAYPDTVPWLEHAYKLNCTKREVIKMVREFTKVEEVN
jgi:hypothetical protein